MQRRTAAQNQASHYLEAFLRHKGLYSFIVCTLLVHKNKLPFFLLAYWMSEIN